jgi:serine/threonine protein kinase
MILIFIFLKFSFALSELIEYDQLIEVFNLQKGIDDTCLQKTINITNSLELIHPESLKNFITNKRCIISAFSRKHGKNLVFKFELKSEVRAWWKEDTINDTNLPMERHVIDLIQGMDETKKMFFIPYYNESMCILKTLNDTVYVYAMEKMNKAQDLNDWYQNNKRNGLNFSAMEEQLKEFFKTIYVALIVLLDQGLVYTDLKPQNILIDSVQNRAYLIDLESVSIVEDELKIGLTTKNFFPPENGHLSTDRILKYTFGMSIYTLVCTSDWKLHHLKADNKEIECNEEISRELKDLINYCLSNNTYNFESIGLEYFDL